MGLGGAYIWTVEFMTPHKVSILCIAFRHEAFIEDCLNGIGSQMTDFPVELWINDDASTDGTVDVIRRWVDGSPFPTQTVFQTENQYSKGRKIFWDVMFPKLTGEYIALCEGDDTWTDPDKLRKQVEFMDAHPDVSLCFHPVDRIQADGRVRSKGTPGPVRILSGAESLDTYIPTLSVVFRRSALDVDRLPRNAPHGDAVLFAYMATKGSIADLGFVGAAYRQHEDGMYSGKSHRKRFLNNLITRRAILASGFLTPDLQNAMHQVIQRKKLTYAKKLFRKLDWIGVWQVMRV